MDSQAATDPQATTVPDPELDMFLIPRRCTTYLILTLCLQYFLYGLYVLLFATYIRIWRRRKNSSTTVTLYFVPMVLLFVLATLLVIVQSIYLPYQAFVKYQVITTKNYDRLDDYLEHDALKTACYALTDTIEIFINSIADYILIHRCYVIWNSLKRIGIPLAFLSIVTNLLGFAGTIVHAYGISDTSDPWKAYLTSVGDVTENASLFMSAIVNSIITLLTAGRIWWMYHTMRQHQSDGHGLLRFVLKILIESGILFPTAVVLQIALQDTIGDDYVLLDLAPSCYLIAALALTLILVRAQADKTAKSRTHGTPMLSTVQFATREENADGTCTELEGKRKGKARV